MTAARKLHRISVDDYLTGELVSPIKQDAPVAVVYRRTPHGFERETHEGFSAVVRLPEIGIELPLADVYEGIDFVPESPEH